MNYFLGRVIHISLPEMGPSIAIRIKYRSASRPFGNKGNSNSSRILLRDEPKSRNNSTRLMCRKIATSRQQEPKSVLMSSFYRVLIQTSILCESWVLMSRIGMKRQQARVKLGLPATKTSITPSLISICHLRVSLCCRHACTTLMVRAHGSRFSCSKTLQQSLVLEVRSSCLAAVISAQEERTKIRGRQYHLAISVALTTVCLPQIQKRVKKIKT